MYQALVLMLLLYLSCGADRQQPSGTSQVHTGWTHISSAGGGIDAPGASTQQTARW